MNDRTSTAKAWAASLLIFLFLCAVLFGSAGTFDYWQAWVFWVAWIVANTALGLYVKKTDPALLERRMRAGPTAETRPSQRIIMTLIMVGCIAIFAIAGLDRRFGWSQVPPWLALLGDGLLLLSYVVFLFVFKQNTYAASTIQLAQDQKVISTGLYHYVRHPMYSGAFFLWIGIPLALGSYWDILVGLALTPVMVWRIFDEEKFLRENLEGYTDYCNRVKFRLIPFLF